MVLVSSTHGVAAWWRRSFPSAAVTMAAVLSTLGSALLVDPEVGAAVLAVALAVALSRSQLERDWRGRLEAGLSLPVLGVVTGGVGFLLNVMPWLGAAIFAGAITGSILLRLAGGAWRRIGRLLALPFVGMLIAPPVHSERYGVAGSLVVAIVVSGLAWMWVTVAQVLARRMRLLPPAQLVPSSDAPARSRLHPPATVRFAVQTATSLACAFTVGFVVFPQRWAWVVLTALIVTLGARGRADVVHKAIHRLLGSGVGTLLALLPVAGIDRAPGLAVGIALIAVFVGVLVRDTAYAWWALAVTVALVIVQQLSGAPEVLLFQRWEEIAIGALIGILPACFLLPVRSSGIARLRIADVLVALQDQLTRPTSDTTALLDWSLQNMRLMTRPFREIHQITRGRARGAASWVALTERCAELGRGGGSPNARQAVAAARSVIREPERLTAALTAAEKALTCR